MIDFGQFLQTRVIDSFELRIDRRRYRNLSLRRKLQSRAYCRAAKRVLEPIVAAHQPAIEEAMRDLVTYGSAQIEISVP